MTRENCVPTQPAEPMHPRGSRRTVALVLAALLLADWTTACTAAPSGREPQTEPERDPAPSAAPLPPGPSSAEEAAGEYADTEVAPSEAVSDAARASDLDESREHDDSDTARPGDVAGPVVTVDACSIAPDSAPVLEFTYESEPILGGGRIESQGAEERSLVVSDVVARHGTYSVRSELRFGDLEVAGGPRAETAVVRGLSDYTSGTEFYYGFSVHIEEGWIDDGEVEDIVFQWHAAPDAELGETSKSPNLFLAVKNGQFLFRITSDPEPVSSDTSPLQEQAVLVAELDTTQATWHDFIFHVSWSYEAQGMIEAWHKTANDVTYRQVLSKMGPNMHNDSNAGYVKWGIYKPTWRAGPSVPEVRVLHHDEIRVGSSFGAVEPGCP